MHEATLLRLLLMKKIGSAGSAHYIKIGRLCMQWPHAIVGAAPIIFNRDGRLRMLRANSLTTLVIIKIKLTLEQHFETKVIEECVC